MDLVDPFGRTIRDLRISVTDRCNFRCTYCMPEEGMKWLPRSEVLSFEEIERLAAIFVERFEVDGLRLTGGEPTVRAHMPVLVRKLAALRVPASSASPPSPAASRTARCTARFSERLSSRFSYAKFARLIAPYTLLSRSRRARPPRTRIGRYTQLCPSPEGDAGQVMRFPQIKYVCC